MSWWKTEAGHERPELRKRSANFVPLSPVSFLARAAEFFGDRVAILHGERRFTYREFHARARQLAHALTKAGVKRGDTVAIGSTSHPNPVNRPGVTSRFWISTGRSRTGTV